MADPQVPSSRAINACLTCRKQKRKCTKERPRCSTCRKTGRACDYTPIGRSSGIATERDNCERLESQETGESAALSRRAHLSGYESRATIGASSPDTEGLFTLFLDSDIPPDRSYLESNRKIPLPPDYLRYLRGPAQVRHEVDVFFNSVHTFFPIGRNHGQCGLGTSVCLIETEVYSFEIAAVSTTVECGSERRS